MASWRGGMWLACMKMAYVANVYYKLIFSANGAACLLNLLIQPASGGWRNQPAMA